MFLDGKYVQTSTARENNWTSGWFLDKWLTAVISHKIILLCRNFRSFSPIFQNSLPWKLEHTNQIPSLHPKHPKMGSSFWPSSSMVNSTCTSNSQVVWKNRKRKKKSVTVSTYLMHIKYFNLLQLFKSNEPGIGL